MMSRRPGPKIARRAFVSRWLTAADRALTAFSGEEKVVTAHAGAMAKGESAPNIRSERLQE